MEDKACLKRMVIKVGSSTLTYESGHLNIRRIEMLTKVLSDIKNSGVEIILVSSGAQAVGMGKMGLQQKPGTMPGKQALAAVGQCELMYLYDKMFSEYNHNVAQVLLTKDIVEDRTRKENVINTFHTLLQMNVIPIVNENDTVAVEEIVFGDNDTLSAIVAYLCGADTLVLLSDIDGLFDKDPHQNADAKLISSVEKIDDKIRALAGEAGTRRGTGGMITKIQAAEIAVEHGIDMVIANGEHPQNLYKILDGEAVGTRFHRR